MSFQSTNKNLAYGFNNALQTLSPEPIIALREPTSDDIGEFGQIWVYNDEVWMFTSISTWTQLAEQGNSGVFTELTVNGDSALNGALVVASGTDAISISADAAATSVNIATGAGAKTLILGSTNTTSSTAINAGTGGLALASTSTGDITLASSDTLLLDSAGVLELNSSGAAISIGNDAVAQAINIGTGAAARTITIGNVTSTTGLVLNSGTGNITISSNSTGNISLVSGKVSSASTTVTNSSFVGNTTITGLTTAAAASFTVTMTNTKVTTSSAVLVSASNLNASTNGAFVAVTGVVIAANTIIITVTNNGGGALGTGDDVHIAHMVLN